MPRTPRQKTATVSVCTTPDEAEIIRLAATAAKLTVSGWAARQVAIALSSPAHRRETREAADQLAAVYLPKGARSARISMILRAADHDDLKRAASGAHLTTHAFAQACLIGAATSELRDLPPDVRRHVEDLRRQASRERTIVADVPQWVATLPPLDLGLKVGELVEMTLNQVRDSGSRSLALAFPAYVAKHATGPLVPLEVRTPSMPVDVLGQVLEVPHRMVATALTMRAATALLKAQKAEL